MCGVDILAFYNFTLSCTIAAGTIYKSDALRGQTDIFSLPHQGLKMMQNNLGYKKMYPLISQWKRGFFFISDTLAGYFCEHLSETICYTEVNDRYRKEIAGNLASLDRCHLHHRYLNWLSVQLCQKYCPTWFNYLENALKVELQVSLAHSVIKFKRLTVNSHFSHW